MNPRIRMLAATLFATGSALAFAQAPQGSPAPADRPVQFVEQPIASSVNNGGEGADTVKPIAMAIAGDPAFKQAKITVHAIEEGNVLLTGVTNTREQMQRAIDIAKQHAGEGKVANALTVEQFMLVQAPDQPGKMVFQQDLQAGGPQAQAQSPQQPAPQQQG